MDRPGEIALLLDFYGALLTERQAEALELHYNEDQSLSEIAAHFGVSRQSVHDAVRIGACALLEYEAKLGFAAEHARAKGRLMAIAADAEAIAEAAADTSAMSARLAEIVEIAERIARLARDG